MADNDFLNQIKNLNNKLTWWQKTIIVGGAIAVLTIMILILFKNINTTEYGVLYNSLDPKDAGLIIEKLKERQIEYQLSDNGQTVSIPKEKVYDIRLQLASEGLPESGTVGYELFDKTNLGMSEFVQKLNYRRALEGELSRTIQSIDEVKKARVHIVIPERVLFEKDQKVPTASISLNLKSDRSTQKVDIEGIQNLVSSSVEGMSPNDVTVVDHRGKILSVKPLDKNSIAGLTEFQLEQQTKFEQYLASKIQSLLDGVLGLNNAEVRVNAELDFTKNEKTITDFNPDRQVARSEQTSEDVSRTIDTLNYPIINSEKKQTNNITNYEISKIEEKIIGDVGEVKRLTIATLVNGTHKIITKNGEKSLQYLPRSDEEMQKLTDIVKNAVGFNPIRNDQVSVLNVPFDASELESEVITKEEIPVWKQPEIIKLIILALAMLTVVLIIYSILNSKPIKDKLKYALSLQGDQKDEPELIGIGEHHAEGMKLDDDDFILMPAQLPEQYLLESEVPINTGDVYSMGISADLTSDTITPSTTISSPSRVMVPEISEYSQMKLELKERIEDYVNTQTSDAVKIIKLMINKDQEEKAQF